MKIERIQSGPFRHKYYRIPGATITITRWRKNEQTLTLAFSNQEGKTYAVCITSREAVILIRHWRNDYPKSAASDTR